MQYSRDNEGPTRGEQADAQKKDYEIYLYPFNKLTVRSHIHPRFVIYETGRKLDAGYTNRSYFKDYDADAYNKITELYDAWTQKAPKKLVEKDESFTPKNWIDPVGFRGAANTKTSAKRLFARRLFGRVNLTRDHGKSSQFLQYYVRQSRLSPGLF